MFLFVLESLSWVDIIVGGIAVVVTLAMLKSGLLQQLFSTTNSLLEKRTIERDDALRERDKYKTKAEELEEDTLMLRREMVQRYEIYRQDTDELRDRLKEAQEALRQLK